MIRSELDVLLDKVQDTALRADLRSQIDRLKQRRSFGLVFEQHIPERVRLPQHAIRVGSQVVSRDDDDSPTFEVILIDDGVATLVRVRDVDGAYVQRGEHGADGQELAPVDSLVVISDFGEPVLPGFRHLGSVERGGDKPYHVVIKGENYHALQALRFTHAGKVDCIYIDPPYNSGARDWKYNNDFVDENDGYRHSKWLAFMERRLKLAKELLNPEDSVLIAAIDENEVNRLGLLLLQTFPASKVQMVTVLANRAGASIIDQFSRVDEQLFFVHIGAARPGRTLIDTTPGTSSFVTTEGDAKPFRWASFLRSGGNSRREDTKAKFFPVHVDVSTERIVGCGEHLPEGEARSTAPPPPAGCVSVWPLKPGGTEACWQTSAPTFRSYLAAGRIRIGRLDRSTGRYGISFLPSGVMRAIEHGELVVTGRDEKGALLVSNAADRVRSQTGKTMWTNLSYSAREFGARLLRSFLPGRAFPFPKSLYAVEDALRFYVADKPNAIVLDYFAGSGTTAHAVARLNRQDDGRRQSIMVTNNEVSVDEAADLRRRGIRPGDPDWEALGIFEHITRPRVTAAITGRTPDSPLISGDYTFTDKFPMADGFDENVAFLELRYLDADDIDLGHAFDDIAPLLWLRAGGQGPIAQCVDDADAPLPYAWTDRYGVLFDEDRWRSFVSARPMTATTAFIVTYSPTVFAGIAAELPASMDTIRLYDTYLSMFLPDRGRA
jgi:adenine-specific DNA-methyltransferase